MYFLCKEDKEYFTMEADSFKQAQSDASVYYGGVVIRKLRNDEVNEDGTTSIQLKKES